MITLFNKKHPNIVIDMDFNNLVVHVHIFWNAGDNMGDPVTCKMDNPNTDLLKFLSKGWYIVQGNG